ncbi:MAG: tetratricopeptide repeat protein [Muribaculaceae bacterium]|nr:tetratricopeptide repeat protein [Muribaculaceae bacterium]
MKFHYLVALMLGASLTAMAEGYTDGIEYYKAGQYDNAITVLNKNMNAAGTDKALANYYLGQAYLNKGDKAKAKEYFNAGIAADANCGYNYVGLGALDLLNKNKNAAEENFKKAQNLAKKNSEITVDIARAYYNADPTGYEKEIDKYIAKARKDSKNHEPEIYIFEGDRLYKNRNYNDAAAQYEQAINFDSDNPAAYVKYANTYFYVVPEYAIQRLEELLQKQPNSALAQRELAEKYFDNGKIGRATSQYGKYMSNPNHFPEDKARYVVLLFANKQYDDAIKTANEVLNESPNDLTLDRIIYRSLNELGRDEEALATAEKFFTNKEYAGRYNAGDYVAYSQMLAKADQFEKALEILNQGRANLPTETSILQQLVNIQSKANRNIDAFESYLQYMGMLENPADQDFNTGSGLALSAIVEAKEDEALRNKYAAIGLEYVDKILDPNAPNANLLLRKVQILLNRNNGVVDEDSEAAILKLMEVLDANPENANPQNPSNSLNVYRILYNQLVSYYDRTGNEEAGAAAKAKLQEYNDLMQ